jgi:hypothetical protein
LVVRMKMNEVELFAHTRDAFQHREVKGLRAGRVFDEPKRGRAGGDKAGARCRIVARKELTSSPRSTSARSARDYGGDPDSGFPCVVRAACHANARATDGAEGPNSSRFSLTGRAR